MMVLVTIEEPSEAVAQENDYGEIDLTQSETWNRVGERWAQVLTQGSREVERVRQVQADVTHIVRMRYDSVTKGLHPKMRLTHRGRSLQIAGAVNVNEQNEVIECLCRERV